MVVTKRLVNDGSTCPAAQDDLFFLSMSLYDISRFYKDVVENNGVEGKLRLIHTRVKVN